MRKNAGFRPTLTGDVIVIEPWRWKSVGRRAYSRCFAGPSPRITHTPDGIPGDPINVALLGSEADVIHAMIAAKWDPSDPLTFRSSARIAVDSVFRRPDTNAPASTLELFGRKQDLAFEQPVGDSPPQRHHVRFWNWDRLIAGLQQAGVTEKIFWLDGFQQLQGKNGGGDPWHTDGRLKVAALAVPLSSPAAATNDPAKP
jgi:LssY C-terminus